MAEAKRKRHAITFDVLYDARSKTASDIEHEIGKKEGEYIRQYQPLLNTQIPKAEDWHKYDKNEINARDVLRAIL